MNPTNPLFFIGLFCCFTGISQNVENFPDPESRNLSEFKKVQFHNVRRDLLDMSYAIPLVYFGTTRHSIQYINKLTLDTEEEIQEHSSATVHVDDILQFTPAAIWISLAILKKPSEHNWKKQTLLFASSYAIMGMSVRILKNNTHVLRPDRSDYYSFPSGHTATAFAGAEFIYQEYKEYSPWVGIGAYVIAGTTGYLRMYNNKHWLTDVVTGAGIGILSTKLIYLLNDLNYPPTHSKKTSLLRDF